MPLLNYTTQVSVEKTVVEISRALAIAKARAVLTEYDDSGILVAISFRVETAYGCMSFRLPAKVDKIHAALKQSTRVPAKLRTREQASRVAWRIIKDWLVAQLALISADMVTVDEVFLPYAQNTEGTTLYEALSRTKFSGLLLPGRTGS